MWKILKVDAEMNEKVLNVGIENTNSKDWIDQNGNLNLLGIDKKWEKVLI